jgi:hypothetical protein
MKLLISIAAIALMSFTAAAQVSFINNQGSMSLVFYVTNLPPAQQAELEKTFWVRHRAVATTNANGTTNTSFLSSYAYATNYVQSGEDTNGAPLFSQVVTTNATLSRQAFLTLIAAPANNRTRLNMREIVDEWCASERRRIGDLRNER